MTPDEMLSEFGIGGRRRTIAPDTLLAIKHHDVRDALDDLYEPLPVEPGQWTRTACGDLQRRLYAALAQVEQLATSIDQVTACREAAVRGISRDACPGCGGFGLVYMDQISRDRDYECSTCGGTGELTMRGMVNDIGPAGYEWPWES